MAMNRKYSALPDLDTAPDIYETPELTDDNSTVLTTAHASGSESEHSDDDAEGISRSRVRVYEARTRFRGATVDASAANFSDRIDTKRTAYRTSTTRQTRRGHGDANDDDDSDDGIEDDTAAGLARKIARLKREVEEAKAAYARQQESQVQAQAATATNPPTDDAGTDLESMSAALEGITRLGVEDVQRSVRQLQERTMTHETHETETRDTTSLPDIPATLYQAASFDRRLVMVERAIGVGSSLVLSDLLDRTSPEHALGQAWTGGDRAILPTLNELQHRVVTLGAASTASLDSISRRVRQLTQEAESLAEARTEAQKAQEALHHARTGVQRTGVQAKAAVAEGAEAKAKALDLAQEDSRVQQLYRLLPTIETLSPLLPMLVDRLRSLRAIHRDAAGASALLDDVARQQAETAAEVAQWRVGLDRLETALAAGEAQTAQNTEAMASWVQRLEARLAKLE